MVRAVGHREADHRAQSEVAIGPHDGGERFVREALQLVEEVHDAGRAGADQLDPAEQRAHVDLVRRLLRCGQHGIREQHPGLERQVVPESAEPVLVRVAVRVHQPGHDREPGAVDPLGAGGSVAGDAPVEHDDVGAVELPRADVDESVLEDYLPGAGIAAEIPAEPSASLATSTTASPGAFAASAWRENASACFTFGTTARASATSTT